MVSVRATRSKSKHPQPPTRNDPPAPSKKELALEQRRKAKARKELIQSFLSAGIFALVIAIALFFVKDYKIAVAGGGGILVTILAYKYPVYALWAFFIYMPFAGTVTYGLFGGSAVFQLAKDGFFIPAFVALARQITKERNPLILPGSLKTPLLILVAICGILFLLTNVPQHLEGKDKPIFMGIIGFKALLGYAPLIPCVYYMLRNKRELLWFVRLHVLLTIICCFLGIVQYMMLSSGICQGTDHLTGDDLFKATIEYRCFIGGSLVFSPSQNTIRLPGTFVAPWQWAWFLIGNTFFTFATAFGDPSLLWKISGFLGLLLVVVNSVISGQRIALFLVPVLLILLLVLTGQISKPKQFVGIVGGLAVLILLASILFPDIVQERIDSAVSRWNASPPTDFIAHQFEFTTKGQSGFLGKGLGRATNAARMFGNAALIETYYPKLLYEMGPLGVISFLGVVTTITIATFKTAYRSVKDDKLRTIAKSFWVFILFISYQTYYYPLDVDPVAVYYWAVVGLVLKIPEIDLEERMKEKGIDIPTRPKDRKKLIKQLTKEKIL